MSKIIVVVAIGILRSHCFAAGTSAIKVHESCVETSVHNQSGIYEIVALNYSAKPFPVYCENSIEEGGWLVMMRRLDGHVNFYRDWQEFKDGFGELASEFFIGLDKLYALTSALPHELLIGVADFSGKKNLARYSEFAIADAEKQFKLTKLGNYSGTAGDSMRQHVGMRFQTKDKDPIGCANRFRGGWWYTHSNNSCFKSIRDGHFIRSLRDEPREDITWRWVQMMIRPKL